MKRPETSTLVTVAATSTNETHAQTRRRPSLAHSAITLALCSTITLPLFGIVAGCGGGGSKSAGESRRAASGLTVKVILPPALTKDGTSRAIPGNAQTIEGTLFAADGPNGTGPQVDHTTGSVSGTGASRSSTLTFTQNLVYGPYRLRVEAKDASNTVLASATVEVRVGDNATTTVTLTESPTTIEIAPVSSGSLNTTLDLGGASSVAITALVKDPGGNIISSPAGTFTWTVTTIANNVPTYLGFKDTSNNIVGTITGQTVNIQAKQKTPTSSNEIVQVSYTPPGGAQQVATTAFAVLDAFEVKSNNTSLGINAALATPIDQDGTLTISFSGLAGSDNGTLTAVDFDSFFPTGPGSAPALLTQNPTNSSINAGELKKGRTAAIYKVEFTDPNPRANGRKKTYFIKINGVDVLYAPTGGPNISPQSIAPGQSISATVTGVSSTPTNIRNTVDFTVTDTISGNIVGTKNTATDFTMPYRAGIYRLQAKSNYDNAVVADAYYEIKAGTVKGTIQ